MFNLINSNILRKSFFFFVNKRRFYLISKSFEKRYKSVDKALFYNNLDERMIGDYKSKWGVFGEKVECRTLNLCHNLSGFSDINIIPENIFASIIQPSLNKYAKGQLSFLSTKNVYEKWFNNNLFPKSYFHKIDNIYYDEKLRVIDNINSFIEEKEFNFPIVCKPSIGTAGGVGVKLLKNKDEIKKCLNTYENLVYQERILQNEFLEEINPGMNTIRTCLYRDLTGKFKVINNSIRFGIDGGLDNETGGGIVCNLDENGLFNDYAVNKYCDKFIKHPNSKVLFSGLKIPFFKELLETSENIANEIPLCNLVSLDMCLDNNNNWRCIEVNLDGQTIRFSQYAGKGFFGKYTDQVINKVLSEL
ncbi:hypothetical protein MUB05_00140 [Acinetobacter indicus]|uniref:sugar-transfer associated ATP-grasp domain-containing protein n=1 Tax=Acinetobacter TaxID=469 RepID=UPI0015D33417|nr:MULTISPECIES: sugar-transfer associated ATP-grasp domain-containing protein [Acinetobacter]MCP0915034.1 hypothetical protein [Acinetobacter indicus]MCP0918159.1 hypothetical protein [Acinetobacter indicus]MCP0920825.1 hypothetical protein [Acinetobacter indicus]